METKTKKTRSMVALIISLLPLSTWVPVALSIPLADTVRNIWAGANLLLTLIGFTLSVTCVRSEESRSIVNILSTLVSSILLLMMLAIVGLGVVLSLQ